MITLRCNGCGYEAEYDDEDDARNCNWWQDDDGEWYCEECHSWCADCDAHIPTDDLTWVESVERSVCESCLEDHYFKCKHCGEYEHNDNGYTIEVNNRLEIWCEGCKNNAEQEGKLLYQNGRLIYRDEGYLNGHIYCQHLHPDIWATIGHCDECIERMQKCPKCLKKEAKEIEAEETTLWIYNTRPMQYHAPDNKHFKETKYREKHENPYLYYGIELECLFNSNAPIDQITREFIKATKGLFVAEYDRSVTNAGNGIEFISRALSYKKWMSEEVYQLLKDGQAVLKKYNAYNPQPDVCGLHVHMSLRFFEKNTVKKVKDIKSDIDWIFQIFQPEMEKISRRKYTKYCASKAFRLKELMRLSGGGYGFNLNPTMYLEKGNLTESLGSGDTHHDAIIQTPRTIEVRTFKSTIIVEEILATIEFCRAIAHAARNMKLNTKNTLGDIVYCKDSKYLPEYLRKNKVDTDAKFANRLEVKI